MAPRFHPQLINDPFGDPGVYVALMFERRALLFDLGDLTALSPRQLLRVSDIFVSHMHMDHFAGFDHLLRCLLGRETTVGLFGPLGLIDAVGHKLAAYTWNLVAGYEGNLVFRVTECSAEGSLRSAEFAGRRGFARGECGSRGAAGDALLEAPSFCVRAATLDHGVPVLAFAIDERAHVNVWRDRVEAMGLAVGPWLGTLKEAVLRGDADATPIEVAWAEPGATLPRTLPLGHLKQGILRLTRGRKIAYVADAAYTEANVRNILALCRDADALFIEAPFLHADAGRAAARRHLTAHQAGTLARLAGAKRLVTFHYSPRYQGRGEELAREAEDAFRGRASARGRLARATGAFQDGPTSSSAGDPEKVPPP
jgi:ribonuclease Z